MLRLQKKLLMKKKKINSLLLFLNQILKLYLPGVILAGIGLLIYNFLQTKTNYWVLHSIWHMCMASSIVFFLPKNEKKDIDFKSSSSGDNLKGNFYHFDQSFLSNLIYHIFKTGKIKKHFTNVLCLLFNKLNLLLDFSIPVPVVESCKIRLAYFLAVFETFASSKDLIRAKTASKEVQVVLALFVIVPEAIPNSSPVAVTITAPDSTFARSTRSIRT